LAPTFALTRSAPALPIAALTLDCSVLEQRATLRIVNVLQIEKVLYTGRGLSPGALPRTIRSLRSTLQLRKENEMKNLPRSILLALAAATITLTGAHAQVSSTSVSLPVTGVHYSATGVKDAGGRELLVAPAYGDLTKGPHGSFVRMPAGFVSYPHIHSDDYWAVVISGVAVNGKPGTPDVQLPVGSYWLQKGGENHVTKCVSPNECVFFLSQTGKFDYVLDKAAK
jgi:hypothetical protein